uniref:Uncharacterized protein n=1 Tax=Oryza brachyantha TaxID=4533 RepID=J3L1I9_ORYBR
MAKTCHLILPPVLTEHFWEQQLSIGIAIGKYTSGIVTLDPYPPVKFRIIKIPIPVTGFG